MSTLTRLENLVSPLGGLFNRLDELSNQPGEPRLHLAYAQVGDLANVFPYVRSSTRSQTAGEMDGTGSHLDIEYAKIAALAEALERYSSAVYSDEQFIWSTATDLGEDALDLDTVPRCSAEELSHPHCPVNLPDKNKPIRWVRGISLMTLRPVWIPAIMVYHYIPYQSIGERFWLPISTGCAAHSSYCEALVSGICEIIERDAISLTWLHRLPLPRIPLDSVPDHIGSILEQYHLSHVTPYLFDATTDLGIPTVYGLFQTPHNKRIATVVTCSADLDAYRAAAKALRECAPVRIALQLPREIPESVDQFIGVFHGAIYTGAPERKSAFDFLLNSTDVRPLSNLPNVPVASPPEALRYLVRLLQGKGYEAYAVDLTTDEALRAGMKVVRVLIPGLQPLSFSTRARFLGHPRLYEAPGRYGYRACSQEGLNPYPQPFA